MRDLLGPLLFTARFAHAFAAAPPGLHVVSPIQRAAWAQIVAAAGRLSRTEEIARALGVTREHLSRSFGRAGAPPLKRVIDLVRLAAAAELTRNPGHQIRDVAAVLGFASSSHLARAALRVLGVVPTALATLAGPELVARFGARHAPGPTPDHDAEGAEGAAPDERPVDGSGG